MTTGVAVVMDRRISRALEAAGVFRKRAPPAPLLNRDALAEAIYRLAAK